MGISRSLDHSPPSKGAEPRADERRATPALDLVSESREALEANFSVALESSRAFWNGLKAVGEELGTFASARVRRQGEFAEGLMSCLVPAAAMAHWAEYMTAEIKAWDDEQSRLMGLFARAMTETMLDLDQAEFPFTI